MSKFQGDYFFDSKYDLRIHIPELFDQKNMEARLSPDALKQIIEERKFYEQLEQWYQGPIPALVCSKIRTNFIDRQAILTFLKAYPRTIQIVLSKSALDTTFFIFLKKVIPKLVRLTFERCKIGDKLYSDLKVLNLQNISTLELAYDPIGNKGVTKVMKLDMPNLKKMGFQFTSLTKDIKKVIIKQKGFLNCLCSDFVDKAYSLDVSRMKL